MIFVLIALLLHNLFNREEETTGKDKQGFSNLERIHLNPLQKRQIGQGSGLHRGNNI